IRATRFLLATGRRRIRDRSDDGHNPRRCAGKPPHCRRWFHRNGGSGRRLSDGSEVSRRLFFSHRSDEQAHGKALRALSVEPLLDLKMRLGEGTGAALAMPILEASAKLLCEMA